MLTYGDGIADIDLYALYNFHKNHGKQAAISAVCCRPIRCNGVRRRLSSQFPGEKSARYKLNKCRFYELGTSYE